MQPYAKGVGIIFGYVRGGVSVPPPVIDRYGISDYHHSYAWQISMEPHEEDRNNGLMAVVSLSFGACDADVGESCEGDIECAAGSFCGFYRDSSTELTCLEICFKDEECEATEICQGLGGTDVCRGRP
ncbi:MAG: hypothetical protein ACI9MR_000559 [Myxococcota bacterium]